LHEGAAHKLIFLRNGRLSNFLGVIANNLNRIALAESDYYARNHLAHHAHFATTGDQEFLNFVFPKRFCRAFIPFASIFDFTDFKAHSDIVYTRSRFLSVGLFVLYHGIYAIPMALRYGWMFVIIALLIIGLNVTLWLDRLRQYTEHNLMPLNVINGARDLGLGFWGMLIGGGPCGQPCHWTHHLYPGLPWYNQLRLHNFIRTILTDEQKNVFFLEPFSGFPKTLLNAIRTTAKYEKQIHA
ncbi:MAG: fatty acid desaturase, partial [Candidatus Omnitrophota bacterium]|nr:fatty acid desaturase [Candidatus Omnitrophota bacterium]